MRKAGGHPVDAVRIELFDGLVSGIRCGGGGEDDRLTESVTLHFSAFKCEYTPQSSGGRSMPIVSGSWNIARNCPL